MERICSLLELLNHPEEKLPVVHVGGTNGKGSVCWITSEILKQAGYKVGSFLSPHICSYRERFLINGAMIGASELKRYLDQVLELVEIMLARGEEHPTEFEVLTAIAFQYFRDQKIDIAVLEVGMGGLYDSTNVVVPEVSVISSVDYDHTQYLGNTLEEIALNKAGIIKAGIPVVIGILPDAARRVIIEQADLKNAPVHPSPEVRINRLGEGARQVSVQCPGEYHFITEFSLLGDFQLDNLAAALTVISLLNKRGFKVSIDEIKRALSAMEFPGRLQVVCRDPVIIADAGHNPHGGKAVAASLGRLWPDRKKILVIGMLDDKDAPGVLRELGGNTRAFIVTCPGGERAGGWRRLADIARSFYPEALVIEEENPERAVEAALGILNQNEYMLISGSFYLLGRICPKLKLL